MVSAKVFGAYATFIAILAFAYFLGWLESIVTGESYTLGFAWGFIGYYSMCWTWKKFMSDKDMKAFNQKWELNRCDRKIKHWQKERLKAKQSPGEL